MSNCSKKLYLLYPVIPAKRKSKREMKDVKPRVKQICSCYHISGEITTRDKLRKARLNITTNELEHPLSIRK